MRRFLLATVLVLICRSAIACDGSILDEKAMIDRADVIFAGHVESVELVQRPSAEWSKWWHLPWQPHEGYRVVLRVSTLLKGQADKRIAIWTGVGHGDCGFSFTPGRAYVVYARKDGTGQLATDIFSGTRIE